MTMTDRLFGTLTASLIVLTAAGGFALGHYYDRPTASQAASSSPDPAIAAGSYYSVFLTNGQVYFGKLSRSGIYLSLTNVYYLGAGGTSTATASNLVKLGGEFHAPKDEMDIPQEQVLFYEPLRDDSPIVQRAKAQ